MHVHHVQEEASAMLKGLIVYVMLGTQRVVIPVFNVEREQQRVSQETIPAHHAYQEPLAMKGDSPSALGVQ